MKKHAAMWIGCLALAFSAGCVSLLPPVQLMSARGAYERAEAGVASKYATAELLEAKVALELAEATFAELGDVQRTRDLSYVARRKAQLAAVVGEAVERRMTQERTSSQVSSRLTAQKQPVRAELPQRSDDTDEAQPTQNQADRTP
jgi:hypothetical protein